ncbi:HNH endonuclease [Mucilaginibacter xinganensis]|uniref:AP2/ERF domain-containing protein n=1 Tax=Mucilaginibacter xinganensis TaxID=1234841 RepID=A0A223NX30_9SPHI|nr:HNH endonuclease [Mucilaginibacter xinganensis]ASU34415.1 hypothetical protein MuYL_2528 [Mucilaginibacter xinganensis]
MTKVNKETILTQEYVKSLFDYREGFLYRIKRHPLDNNGKSKIGEKAGWVSKTHSGERRLIRIGKYAYYSSRLIFFYHNNCWPEIVDHRDRDKLNDKIENLRAASNCQNARNVSKQKNKTSQYLGVNLKMCKTTRKLKTTGETKTWVTYRWCAQAVLNKKKIALGNFDTELEAAIAYNKHAKKHYGEFANLNNI